MHREYTHELNKEVRSISGMYELEKEGTIEIDGKEVVYAVGNALLDSSCCGRFGCRYAVVPGFVVNWKYKKNDQETPVSTVEPITNEDFKKEISKILEANEWVNQVRFW
ncbi:MAG: hypothetical protein ABII26_06690 [Pseudomonadota bacterium]